MNNGFAQPTWTQVNPAIIQLAQGQTTGTVAFPVPFFGVPFLVLANTVLANGSEAVITVGVYGVSQNGFSFTLSSAPADGSYQMTWSATAFQPAPPCSCGGGSPFAPGGNPFLPQSGQASLTSGQTTGSITFATPFLYPPRVTGTVIKPSGGSANIFASFYNVTTTGFSYSLTFPPGSGYLLDWIAAPV